MEEGKKKGEEVEAFLLTHAEELNSACERVLSRFQADSQLPLSLSLSLSISLSSCK